jgi:hypothetical protein
MRRLALSILTACGLAFVTACSGGSGFSGSSSSDVPTGVVLYAGEVGQTVGFEVVPAGTSPLLVSAVGYKGGAIDPNVVVDSTFTWAARYVNPLTDPPSVATYTVGTAPSSFKSCPAVPAITPAVPILQYGGSGTESTLYPGFTIMPASQSATQVYLGSVPGVTAPYCLVIQATSVNGGVIGAHTVIVSQSP